VAFIGPPGAAWFAAGINVQNNQRNFAPVGTLRIRVQYPQVGDEVFVIIRRNHGIAGRGVGDIRI
jgi:hypothetical protein